MIITAGLWNLKWFSNSIMDSDLLVFIFTPTSSTNQQTLIASLETLSNSNPAGGLFRRFISAGGKERTAREIVKKYLKLPDDLEQIKETLRRAESGLQFWNDFNDFLSFLTEDGIKEQNLDTNIDNEQLDILELFAQTKYLTVTSITDIIKSTKLGKAYKNVRRTIQKLKSLYLIEETLGPGRGRHNEKFLKLGDEGIYLLFLKRLQGILVNQLLVKKGEIPVSYVHNFINQYGDNFLFEFFLYPYFEKQTISVENFNLVVELFNYLNECCKRLDLALRMQVPFMITKFSWNKIPGQDEIGLLTSLKQIFDLHDTEMSKIRIDKPLHENVIKIIAPQWSVMIELETGERKAVATLVSLDSNPRKYEYKIAKAGSEIFVGTLQPFEDPIKRTLDYSSSLIKQRIYELVSDMGSDFSRDEKNNITLAQDDKFMAMLEDIHNNMHNRFERGYDQLMDLRKRR